MIQPKKRKRLFEFLKKSYYIKLETYVCDVKGFLPYVQDLRKYIFRFKSKDISQANMMIKKIKKIHPIKNPLLVSIHIRLQDMEKHLTNYNVSLASQTYFTNSMNHMTKKFGKNIIFVVVSEWYFLRSSYIVLSDSIVVCRLYTDCLLILYILHFYFNTK